MAGYLGALSGFFREPQLIEGPPAVLEAFSLARQPLGLGMVFFGFGDGPAGLFCRSMPDCLMTFLFDPGVVAGVILPRSAV
jgi:hypothetical protein